MPAANASPVIGAVGDRFPDVRRIAVLRGGGLGDVVFALPALTAIAAAYPDASITVLGSPLHRSLLEGRPSPVETVVELPFVAGVRDGRDEDVAATEEFFRALPAFDLAIQMHGGGRHSNPFLRRLGARNTVGLATSDAEQLDRTVPYIYYQHEVLRALEVAAAAGAVPVDLEPRLEVTQHEITGASARRRAERLVVIHPGATDLRRRWPAEHFGEVAGWLARDGVQVIVVGDETDADAAATIVERAAATAGPDAALVSSVTGSLALGDLVGLAAACDVFLGNDSGPRHLAQAAGAATVGVFWAGNVIIAGPLSRSRQRVQLSWTTNCPECGRDVTQVGWTAPRCEHDFSMVADVAVDAVLADVRDLLDGR